MDDESWHALLRQLRELSDSLLATKAHSGEIQTARGPARSRRLGQAASVRRLFARLAAADRGLLGRLADERGTLVVVREVPASARCDSRRGAAPVSRRHDAHEGRRESTRSRCACFRALAATSRCRATVPSLAGRCASARSGLTSCSTLPDSTTSRAASGRGTKTATSARGRARRCSALWPCSA